MLQSSDLDFIGEVTQDIDIGLIYGLGEVVEWMKVVAVASAVVAVSDVVAVVVVVGGVVVVVVDFDYIVAAVTQVGSE